MIQYQVKADADLNRERLTQVFNSALVTTRSEEISSSTAELYRLIEQSAFGAILNSIQTHATEKGISEVEAAREVIQTFRKIDSIWTQFLLSEGVERLKQNS